MIYLAGYLTGESVIAAIWLIMLSEMLEYGLIGAE